MSVKTSDPFRFSEQNFVQCLTFPYVLLAHPTPCNRSWFSSLMLVIWCLALPRRSMFIYTSPELSRPVVLMVDTNFWKDYAVSILRFEFSRVNQPPTRLRVEICTWGKWHLVRLKPSYLWMAQLTHRGGMYIGRLQEKSLTDGKEIWGCLIFCTPFPSPRSTLPLDLVSNHTTCINFTQFSPVRWS